MSAPHQPENGMTRGVNYAPWERTFSKIVSPFEEFIHRETTSGMLLMIMAVVAMLLANSMFADAYHHLLHAEISLNAGSWTIGMSLHHWVNDGLMALFFFVVGLELKRELLVGELSDLKQAALPVIAAIGGMLMPALIYLAFNHAGDAMRGWCIPMATDIAFAVGVLVLLAARVPKSLITFLVALAIADDLGAVLVIALFYTSELSISALMAAAIIYIIMIVLNVSGVRRILPYFLLAVVLWYALLQSGVHATLAGVLGAFAVPARSKYDPSLFSENIRELLARFDASRKQAGSDMMSNEQMHDVARKLEDGVKGVQTPLQQLEQAWHLPVAFIVIPIFALINAGIPLQLGEMAEVAGHPVFLGVMLGLLLGKFVGISGACWLALKLGIGQLPGGTRFSQVVAVSVLGGIGFTMSIFITELAFAGQEQYLLMAKTGILAASALAGIIGLLWLGWLGRPQK